MATRSPDKYKWHKYKYRRWTCTSPLCTHNFLETPTCMLIGCTLTLSHSSKLFKYWISIENAFIAKTCMFVIGSWEVGRRKEDKRRGRRTEKNGGRTIKTARRISASWAWKTKTSDRGKSYYLKVNNTKTTVWQLNFGINFSTVWNNV